MMTSEEEIAALEEWMNEYPREIFEYDTAASRVMKNKLCKRIILKIFPII